MAKFQIKSILTRRVVINLILTFFLWLGAYPTLGFAGNLMDDSLGKSLNLIVMVEGKLSGASIFGAGIIVGGDKENLFIVTANHLVRRGSEELHNIKIKFKVASETVLNGVLTEHFHSDLDLAVIKIVGITQNRIDRALLDFHVLGQKGSISPGEKVFPVGNPNNEHWSRPSAPDRMKKLNTSEVSFESAFINNGHSGGALIEESGILVGMITGDQPPHGLAINIHKILEVVEVWGYPIGLKPAHAYGISGKWVGVTMFDLLTFKVAENKLSGTLTVAHPRVKMKTDFQPVSGGKMVTTQTYTNFSSASPEISGEIKGNQIMLETQGKWRKSVRIQKIPPSGPMGFPAQEDVPFKVQLLGTPKKDKIQFVYSFDYPQMGDQSQGEFIAVRKKSPPPKPTWQKILKEVLESEHPLTKGDKS